MNFKLFKQIAADNIVLSEMKFIRELNMEAFIIENPQLLSTDEYSNVDIIQYQLPIKSGRKSKGTDGRIDLLASIDDEFIAIIELKNGMIKDNHINQLNDYMSEFSSKKESIKKELSEQYEIKGHKLLGIIVGTDIFPDIKSELIKGKFFNGDIPIIGMTINRYSTEDNKEVYILSETFAPPKSKFSRIRFNNWSEFKDFQIDENKVQKSVLNIAKELQDKAIKEFGLQPQNINYAQGAFTLNVPIQKRKTVFAYFQIMKKKIRVFMDFDESVPPGGTKVTSSRYPHLYYVDVNSQDNIDNSLINNIKQSYEILSR